MKKSKVWLYVLYTIVLFSSLLATSWVMFMVRVWMSRTFKPIPAFFVSIVLCILLGLILGLEHFIKEYHKEGKWKVDSVRLTIIGIPSCIFAFYSILFIIFPIRMPTFLYINNFFFYFSGVIFGYTIITSLNKKGIETLNKPLEKVNN